MSEEIKENISIFIKGTNYSYKFSRGLHAYSLSTKGLSLDDAYFVSEEIYSLLMEHQVNIITEDELIFFSYIIIRDKISKESARIYTLYQTWVTSDIPLIILLSAVRGTKRAEIGKRIANKIGIQRIVSTNVVTNILKKTISSDLAPELHSKSYLAYKALRPMYSVLYDKVLVGFEEHARYPTEGVEALIRRALQENQSMIIRGEHLLPRFLSPELINNPSVIYITLQIKDEAIHKERFLQRYNDDIKEKRLKYFDAIRKIHDYLIEEAKNRGYNIVDVTKLDDGISEILSIINERLNRLFHNINNIFDVDNIIDNN